MINFGKNIVFNTFDQNRLSAGFYFNLNEFFDLEVGYSHWYQQRSNGQSFDNRHILRLALSHTIDLSIKD
jgi:hypothetical protein